MRVVIADDSKLIREVWRAMLINLGHKVVGEGADGLEAIKLCAKFQPDLVILDMSMGEIGGDIASVKIREADNARLILLCTSRASMKEACEAKGFAVIIKPIMQGNLEKKIEQLVALRDASASWVA